MIRLKCINSRPLKHANGTTGWGCGLRKGKTYTSPGLVIDEYGYLCYYINELQEEKLFERFVVIEEDFKSKGKSKKQTVRQK